MTKQVLILLSAIIILISCTDQQEKTSIKTHFQGDIEKRNINLQRLLSNEFTTVDDRDGGNRISYLIEFDNESKMNYIIDKANGDTLLETLVSKYKKLWFLEQPSSDSTFYLSALSLEDNYIKGWQANLNQVKIDQGLLLDKMVEAGKMDELLIEKTEDNYLLKPEKRILKDIFSEVLDSLDKHTKLYAIGSYDEIEVDETADYKDTNKYDSEKIIKNVYPNPASTNVTIELYEEGNYLIQLFDKNGQIVKEIQMTMEEMMLDVSDLEAGTYIIALEKPSNRMILDKTKLVVSP